MDSASVHLQHVQHQHAESLLLSPPMLLNILQLPPHDSSAVRLGRCIILLTADAKRCMLALDCHAAATARYAGFKHQVAGAAGGVACMLITFATNKHSLFARCQ